MKIVSWNVNGIRAGIRKGTFLDYLRNQKPDIIGLQEVKANYDQLSSEDLIQIEDLGYQIYWNSAHRAGYSGTALLTKIAPIKVNMGIETAGLALDHLSTDEVIESNHEGRVIVAEYSDFYSVTVYTPNSKNDLSRLTYRQVWDEVFLKYMKTLEKTKPVIFCGDLNVAYEEIDLANPQANKTTKTRPGYAGFTDSERAGFGLFLDAGFIDTYRYFHPEQKGAYTWWSNFSNARANNVGWRIDYVMISPQLLPKVSSTFIHQTVFGSDHCPVGIEI